MALTYLWLKPITSPYLNPWLRSLIFLLVSQTVMIITLIYSNLFLTSNPTICKPSGLSPLGNSDHAVVQIDISSNFKPAPEAPFHRTLYSYHCGDWDSFRDLLWDIPWQSVFDLPSEDCAKKIISWLESGIEAFVPSRKYQVKPHSSPWFNQPVSLLLLTGITTFTSINAQ